MFGRAVEIVVGVSALCGVLGFLGLRTAVRSTLRKLGRDKDGNPLRDREGQDGYRD